MSGSGKALKIDKEQVLADIMVNFGKTPFIEVKSLLDLVIKGLERKETPFIIELNGRLYPDKCSGCNNTFTAKAYTNNALPDKIFCSRECINSYFIKLTSEVTVLFVK